MLASLTTANSSSSCLTLVSSIGTRRGARRKGWIRELLQIAFAPTAPASPLLGGDEQNPRLERATKQPLPSLLGSCELWLSARRRCEAAVAAAGSPQPWPCPVPLVCPLVLPSPNSVGFWGHTLYLSTAQTTSLLPKAPRGRTFRFSFLLARSHSPTCGDPGPPRARPPNSRPLAFRGHYPGTKRPHRWLLYFTSVLYKQPPGPSCHHHHHLRTTSCVLHPPKPNRNSR